MIILPPHTVAEMLGYDEPWEVYPKTGREWALYGAACVALIGAVVAAIIWIAG